MNIQYSQHKTKYWPNCMGNIYDPQFALSQCWPCNMRNRYDPQFELSLCGPVICVTDMIHSLS